MNMMKPDINLSEDAPREEPSRQYYYIEKAKQLIQKKSGELGRPLTAAVITFGCQMNTEHEIEKAA